MLFCVRVQGNRKVIFSLNSLFTMYLMGVSLKLVILVYSFEIMTICYDFNFDKVPFDVNSFLPEIMVL